MLCSPDRNPAGPRGLPHFIPTSPEAPALTSPVPLFRAFAFVAHVQNVFFFFFKFSLCNQSSSLKQPVNPFSSPSSQSRAGFGGFLWISPEGEVCSVSCCCWGAHGCVGAAQSLPWLSHGAKPSSHPHPPPTATSEQSPRSCVAGGDFNFQVRHVKINELPRKRLWG